MATREGHLEQARANLAFAERLLRESPSDPIAMQWAVTAAFYCALHCLEAHVIGQGIQSRTHRERDVRLADPKNGIPADVYAAYRKLKQRSEQARYETRRFTAEAVEHIILGRYLPRVTTFVGL